MAAKVKTALEEKIITVVLNLKISFNGDRIHDLCDTDSNALRSSTTSAMKKLTVEAVHTLYLRGTC